MITIGANVNAVLPLVAKHQLVASLGSSLRYELFLNATTIPSCLLLLACPFLLRGWSNRTVVLIGFVFLGLLNLILCLTDLQWHPLALRILIGMLYGCVIPMGQFTLSQAEMEERERIDAFTMMLNLVAVGLTVMPFTGILLLDLTSGRVNSLFLLLSVLSFLVAILGWISIPKSVKVRSLSIADLRLPRPQRDVALGDGAIILWTRGVYAFVLVWLSHVVSGDAAYQAATLTFTLPFVLGGFLALRQLRQLTARQSARLFLWLPALALAFAIAAPHPLILAPLLLIASLLSIPEAFTPGQFVSQWQTLAGRQFANVATMAMMTLSLSLGPALYALLLAAAEWLSSGLGSAPSMTSGLMFLALAVPLTWFLSQSWQRQLIPRLHAPPLLTSP